MGNKFRFKSEFNPKIKSKRHLLEDLKLGGFFSAKARNPDGTIAWEEKIIMNGVTNAGLNSILDVYFHGGTQITTWYIGLISTLSALAASDTMSSHGGWTESSAYDEATREEWLEDAPSGQAIGTLTEAEFTINATITIRGAFIVSNSTKGGSTGTLWATGSFASPQALLDDQVLVITYNCAAASA